jgi:CPA1 family monovalent cation:H+ antiporter
MSAFEILATLLSLAAALAYLNHRWLHRPASIALMAMSLCLSLGTLLAARCGWVRVEPIARLLDRVALDQTLLHGMLGALLFAGALHVRVADLKQQWLTVGLLALAGTLLSTLIVGGCARLLSSYAGLRLSLGECLLFGAIVSPTDPIAVLAILKQARVPRSMAVQIGGESLFNDGVGVVVFTTVLGVVERGGSANLRESAVLFAREALGGAAFGFLAGYVVFLLLRSIDHYQTELLLTLALVLGGYALAERLHLSAPLASVVAGLVIGNHGRAQGMSDVTRDHLDKFWELVDEVLNAVLFVLVGLAFIRLKFTSESVAAGFCAIPIVLFARWLSVGLPVRILARFSPFARGTVRLLTWGGLRGAISVALALSLPALAEKGLLVTMTYFVVSFSILVQGLTLERVARRFSA